MARNGSGVKKASASSVEIEFQYNGERCRERIKCKPTPTNIRKLILFRDELLESIELGTFDYQATFPNSKRFKKPEQQDNKKIGYWLKVLINRSESKVKASTYKTLSKTCAVLDNHFGDKLITEIKRKDVRQYCETLACGNRQIRKLVSANFKTGRCELPCSAGMMCYTF